MRGFVVGVCCALTLLVGAGCERGLAPRLPCVQRDVQPSFGIPRPDELDLLLMVDDGPSMAEAQAALAAELPGFLQALTTGEVREPDTGALLYSFPPVRSLRVGVISGDMGTGGFSVPTCGDRRFGDDGRLATRGNVALDSRCMASYPSFLEFERDPSATDEREAARIAQLGVDLGCVARLGTSGCTFQQPLDAVLKALTPASSSLTFQEGTPGNGDVNRVDGAGFPDDIADDDAFVRDTSMLVVIALTDQDDCSTFEPDLYNPASTRFTGDLRLRCFNFPEAVYPLSRFRDGLRALRPGNPGLLLFAPIVGVPPDLLSSPRRESVDHEAILADPRMQEVVDPANDTRLAPSCEGPGGPALPPRRMVTLAQELEEVGVATSLQSLCTSDFSPALFDVLELVARELSGSACLARPLNRDAFGLVTCELHETLPASGEPSETQCALVPGRGEGPIEVAADPDTGLDRETCRVQQLTREAFERTLAGDGDAGGWVYDDFGPDLVWECPADRQQRFRFVPGSEPIRGSVLRFVCTDALTPSRPPGVITLGDTCFRGERVSQRERDDFCLLATTAPSAGEGLDERLVEALPAGGRLFCEPVGLTCQVACASDADCPRGASCIGLPDPSDVAPPVSSGFCFDPTCVSFGAGIP